MKGKITDNKTMRAVLKHAGISPRKQLGQNFLVNTSVAETIVKSAEVCSDDVVVEPGAGIGALTFHIAAKAEKVIAVEIEERLCKTLVELADGFGVKNIEIANKDVLAFDPAEHGLKNQKYKVVGSLPYGLSKKIIRKFVEKESVRPSTISVLIQREVAKEYVARPPNTTFLAQYAQIYAEPKYVQTVTKRAFYPVPPVDGGILILKVREKLLVDDADQYRSFLKICFTAKRRTLLNTLSKQLKIDKDVGRDAFAGIGIGEMARPQEVSTEQWVHLWKSLKKNISR